MDPENYDEFGNYIGPELDSSDSEPELEEEEEQPVLQQELAIEGTEETHEDESMQVNLLKKRMITIRDSQMIVMTRLKKVISTKKTLRSFSTRTKSTTLRMKKSTALESKQWLKKKTRSRSHKRS